ncbi:MAG: hypothetical protein J0M34_09505 [Alphaproteobacteria bacterium]|nr:hypothetical protein [Alphaproteobacteria bacterium]
MDEQDDKRLGPLPPSLKDWGEPMSDEDQAVIDSIIKGTPKPPTNGNSYKPELAEARREQNQYELNVYNELGAELAIAARSDGNTQLSAEELARYFQSSAIQEGFTRSVFNCALAAQVTGNPYTLARLQEFLRYGALNTDFSFGEGVAENALGILRSIPPLQPTRSDPTRTPER